MTHYFQDCPSRSPDDDSAQEKHPSCPVCQWAAELCLSILNHNKREGRLAGFSWGFKGALFHCLYNLEALSSLRRVRGWSKRDIAMKVADDLPSIEKDGAIWWKLELT